MKKEKQKEIVNKHYSRIAKVGGCCGSCGSESKEISKSIGYSDSEINSVADANLGLGCGNPTALGEIKEGDTVLDLGSGAGFDCFLAARKVEKRGKVIGVDFSVDMIEKARANGKKYKYDNVEFRQGDIEDLPVEDNSIDIVISNCVINLSPDKAKVFSEIARVLKNGAKAYISDIVLLKELSEAERSDEQLLAGCVSGAQLKDDYLKLIKKSGLNFKILSEDKKISKRQYQNAPLESLKLELKK